MEAVLFAAPLTVATAVCEASSAVWLDVASLTFAGVAADAGATPATARRAAATPVTTAGDRWDNGAPSHARTGTGALRERAVVMIGPPRPGGDMAGSNVVVTDHKAPLGRLVGRIDRD